MEIVDHAFLPYNSDEQCGSLYDEDFGCIDLSKELPRHVRRVLATN